MKRILVLNYEFPPLGGGASPVSYDIAKRLSETGDFDIDVVTMGYKDLPKYEEVNKNFRIHRVKSWRSKKEICHPWEQATYLVSGWFKCKELLNKNKYNICHTHFIIPTGVLALKLKKKFGLPYIITSHGSDVLGYNARFKLLYPFLIKKWESILDNAQKIISPSNFLKTEILKVYPEFDGQKIEVIPNGFDTNKFKPQEKKKYIFSSGRLLRNKGFQYLIQAAAEEDLGWEVHIAGDGPMRAELEEMAKKSKTKVVLHGWLDNNGREYKDLLEQASIFVLASESESFGMVIAEAMSAGCAIISSDTSGCAEITGESGLLTKVGDIVDLQSKLVDLVSDSSLTRDFQTRSLEKSKEFDWSSVLREYIKML